MVTVVLPLSAFVIRISGLLFRKVQVDLMSWITLFCKSVIGFFVCFWREKVVMQFKNFNLAAFLSSSLIFWILDSKSATNCFMGNWLLGMGVPKFLPRLTVLATEGGMWMSVRLVNQESVKLQSTLLLLFFVTIWLLIMRFWNWNLQLFLCAMKICCAFIDSKSKHR